jgi:hypothetical protein
LELIFEEFGSSYMKRFLDKINKIEGGCWEWMGASRGKSGYGCLKINKKVVDVHRFSYVLHKGEIPKGLLVCHTCDNRICCNPDHLFLGTHKENHKDAVNKGRITFPNNEHLRLPCGNSATYNRGCRCIDCKKAHALYRKNERLKKGK